LVCSINTATQDADKPYRQRHDEKCEPAVVAVRREGLEYRPQDAAEKECVCNRSAP
jgi:hypothetical protein